MNAQNKELQNVQRIQKLERELAKETAKVAALKQAAAPIAKLVNWFPASTKDEAQTTFDSPDGHIITVGELRKLAELLK